ncbi:MAG: hypothetical protein ABTQ27_10095 [Amaricoccus sp.]
MTRVGPKARACQRALAGEFHGLGILPKALNIEDIVWQPKAARPHGGIR